MTKEEQLIKGMIKAGVHFGHSKSRKSPKMTSYIYGLKNKLCIIDLLSSLEKMNQALDIIKEILKKDGLILFVGIQPQAKKITKEIAEECNMPYVVERWLGGTLTNFETIHKRIEHLRDLEKKKAAGELKKYTKKEQMLFDQEIEKLNKNIGGIKKLDKLPDALLVLSIKKSTIVLKEAWRTKIPVIGLADTDCDPSLVDYPIPSNDDAISALKFMLEQVKKIILKNKKDNKKENKKE